MPRRVNPEDANIRTPEMENVDDVPFVDVSDDTSPNEIEMEEEGEDKEGTETEEPSADEEAKEEVSVRRSRRDGKRGRPSVNLDEFEEFRRFKSEADRRLAEERKRREELERKLEERAALEAEMRRQELARQLAEDDLMDDPVTKQRLLDEYARSVWEQNQAQLRKWQKAKRDLLTEMGLDPDDDRFNDEKYADDPDTAWYRLERDAAKAKAEQATEEARRAKAMLDDLPNLVRREVAKIAAKSGMAIADLGEETPEAEPDQAEWERDVQLLQTGRLSPERYLRKWGGK